MSSNKRQKLSDSEGASHESENEVLSEQETSSDERPRESEQSGSEEETLPEPKSRHTSKRKIRATKASTFGAALTTLLTTDTPSTLPLSLKPSIARKHNDEKLELRAKKVLRIEKKEKEDKGRVTDVIGGWGGESERALRKVAQRGVVKLFNVIQQAQDNAAASVEETKGMRGTGKPTLPAPIMDKKLQNKGGSRTGVTVPQNDFFEMIKAGGIVSKV